MPRIIIVLFILACISCQTIKQSGKAVSDIPMFPIGKDGSWGYASEGGDLQIDYLFDEAKLFNQSRAAVKVDGKYGFINRNGEFLIKPKYDSIISIRSNHSLVQKRKKQYWIDLNGKKVKGNICISGGAYCGLPKTCSNPQEFFYQQDDKFILNQDQVEIQQRFDPTANFTSKDFTFDELKKFSSKSIIVKKGNHFGIFIHYNGVGLHERWYDEIFPDFSSSWTPPLEGIYESHAAIVKEDDKWGLISNLGPSILEPQYLSIKPGYGSFYLVEYKPNHWGYISTSKKKYF